MEDRKDERATSQAYRWLRERVDDVRDASSGRGRHVRADQLDDAEVAGPVARRRPFEPRRGARRRPGELCACDLMTTTTITVSPGASLHTAADLMRRHHVGVVPVLDDERHVLGMLTDRDLVTRAIASGKQLDDTQVEEIMSRDVVTTDVLASARELVDRMARKHVRRIPILDDDQRMVGIVALEDIALRADGDEALQEILSRTAARRSFWQGESWR